MLSSAVTNLATAANLQLVLGLAQVVEFVGQRDRFVGRVHVTRPLRSFPFASPQPGPWPTSPRKPSFFAIAPGRQEHSEAQPNVTRGDDGGFATEPRPWDFAGVLKELLRITLVLCQKASLQADVRHVQGANLEAQRGPHHRNTDAKLAQFCKTCRTTHTRKHRTDSHKRSSSPCEGKIMIEHNVNDIGFNLACAMGGPIWERSSQRTSPPHSRCGTVVQESRRRRRRKATEPLSLATEQ